MPILSQMMWGLVPLHMISILTTMNARIIPLNKNILQVNETWTENNRISSMEFHCARDSVTLDVTKSNFQQENRSVCAVYFLPFRNFYETSNALRRRPLPSSSSIIFYFHSLLLICTADEWVYTIVTREFSHIWKRILRHRLLHDITHFSQFIFAMELQ